MLKILNKNEISYISGGWICSNTYKGKPFLKATWHRNSRDHVKFGTCYYGKTDKENIFYAAPSDLMGIVQEPNNYWTFSGTTKLEDTLYECKASAAECVFK